MTLMSPLVTGVHHHEGLRRNSGGAPPMGVVVRVRGDQACGCMAVGRAAGVQGCRVVSVLLSP
jgi:hypothetical protein